MTQSNSSKNSKSFHNDINKNEPTLNRGIEFILNGGKKKQPKPFRISFGKMVRFFHKELDIYFEFSLRVRKINHSNGVDKC